MPETLQSTPEQAGQGDDVSPIPLETVFHGTSVEAAKSILSEGFKPTPHAHRPELGPISWFSTESLVANGYGDPNAPLYNVVVEAEIPKSSDPRGFNTMENGIEYLGTTRLVTALGMSHVAIRTMRLYERLLTANGTISTSGKLIDEYTFRPNRSILEHVRNKIRRTKNKIMGRPTL